MVGDSLAVREPFVRLGDAFELESHAGPDAAIFGEEDKQSQSAEPCATQFSMRSFDEPYLV